MRFLKGLSLAGTAVLTAGSLWAGGSGLNVIVVVNQGSTNSVQLGNAYCEQRGVPPQNVLRMTGWSGGAVEWSQSDFNNYLRYPLLAFVANRGLTNQAEYVLLSMDIPYRVADNGSYNSTTSALFYGFKTNDPSLGTCSLPDSSSNSYALSEMPFTAAPPNTASMTSLLAMMLTASNLNSAQRTLSRAVASDGTFPTQAVYLAKTTDTARNVRFVEFDNAIFGCRVQGDHALISTNTDSTSFTNLLGLQTGLWYVPLPTNAFVPGAIGDSLTSYGGLLFENSGQTSLLAFLDGGAAGSYGTVTEPCNYTQKFPDPLDYFYQYRGFCLAEAYYQSVQNPFQGLMGGEPLAAPFARPGTADWNSLTNGAVLSGQAALGLHFSSAATNLPLGQVDLFLDGTFLRTVTNIPPAPGNVLSTTVNRIVVNYTVPANATVATVAAGLAAALNSRTSTTRVQAYLTGDRLELQSLNAATPGSNVTLTATSLLGSATQLTTFLSPTLPAFLDTIATGYLGILASNTPIVGDKLQLDFTKTNGSHVTVSVTNTSAGTTISNLTQNLADLVNATPALQSSDGVFAADFMDDTPYGVVAAQFNLYARSPGWPASSNKVTFTSSPNLVTLPTGSNLLQDNLTDLRPRNHLYVSSGANSLPVSFVLDTTRLADGFHQLTVVAYEGTSVRTQTRVSRTVRVQNTSLTATFTPLLLGTNTTLEVPLQFSVTGNALNIGRIELFSTGGSVGVVSNQPSAVFTAPSALLGLGLHPFYALVTDTTGKQYQTETVWIRLIPSIVLTLSGTPLTLSWPATPGVSYNVLSTTNLSSPFQAAGSVVATGELAQWPVSAPAGTARFYRVSLRP
jgi:uncharacterized protein (TIGR03790 family)